MIFVRMSRMLSKHESRVLYDCEIVQYPDSRPENAPISALGAAGEGSEPLTWENAARHGIEPLTWENTAHPGIEPRWLTRRPADLYSPKAESTVVSNGMVTRQNTVVMKVPWDMVLASPPYS